MKKTSWKSIKNNIKQQNSEILIVLYTIKMRDKTLKFGDVEFNEKKFHASK